MREKWHCDRFFSDCFGFPPPVSFHHLLLHVAVTRKSKQARPGNVPKSNALLEIGNNWMEKCVHSLFLKVFRRLYLLVTARLVVPYVRDMRDKTCVRQAGRYDLSVTGLVYPFYAANT